MYDIAVIGAGIIGTSVARELSRYSLKIALIEKDNDVANGTTKANSGIIHAGYDARPGSNKAKYNALGNPMFDKLCQELAVPFKRIGSLVIASNSQDMEKVEELYNRGLANGIPEMRILNGSELRKLEPNLKEGAVGALHAPTAGIIDPWDLAIALAENAVDNGVKLLLNHRVTAISSSGSSGGSSTSRFNISFAAAAAIEARQVINCAGVYADEINNMAATPYFKITPRRGQYYVLDKNTGSLVNSVVFQCPGKMGKGVLITSSIHGNLLIGPDSEILDDKENVETTADRLLFVKGSALNTAPGIPFNTMIKTFAGLRASPSTRDFIIEESKERAGFINVAGIESPGLTAAPAIAQEVIRLLKATGIELIKRDDFNPLRRKVIRFMELEDHEKADLIRKNPSYGRVICRCENVTEGEVVDAITRGAGATTVSGIKRRVRPGMGRCQGGFCAPKVMEILSRELGVDMPEIVNEGKESYILSGTTKGEQDYKGKERGE